ncbi:MAG: Cna B-type domain-containing protein [Lachnospiraceae bacterium]|nr:Cna B-type domain-containing protein [Lachnospiraceae bacterium]
MILRLIRKHNNQIKSILSILLCLALIGGAVSSLSVFAEEPVTESESESEFDLASETETQTDVSLAETEETAGEPQTKAASEPETEEQTRDTGAEAEMETESESEKETEIESETETESKSETESESDTEMTVVEFSGNVGDIDVLVTAPAGAFAEGVTMEVEEADLEAFVSAVQTDLEENYPGTTYHILDVAAIEISFYDANGNEVQPEADVEVTISGLSLATEVSRSELFQAKEEPSGELPPSTEEPSSELFSAMEELSGGTMSSTEEMSDEILSSGETLPGETLPSAEEIAELDAEVLTADYALIYHMDDEGNVECVKDETPGESSYTFTTDCFSEYGIVNASEEGGTSLTAGSPGSGGGGGPSGGQTESETQSGTTTYNYYHIDLRVSSTVDITITNSATTTTDVTVTKVWEDDDESDRPSSITVYLTDANGNYITDSGGDYITATLTAANNWTYTWEDLSLEEGTYTVTEDAVSGYTMTGATTFTIADSSTATSVTYTGTITVSSITSLIVTHDGTDYEVEMSTELTLDENDNVYELASVAGHGSNGSAPTSTLMDLVTLEEGGTITVTVVYSYYYVDSSGNVYSGSNVTTTVTITVDEDDNICDGTAGTDQYGFDFKITALQLLEAESVLTDDQELTITNTADTASITVVKEVTGNMGDTTKEFTFTLTDSNGDPVGTDSGGSALTASGFTLSSGESETISGLTIGDTVYLAESDNDGYTVTVTDSSGNTIEATNGVYEITVGSDVTITVTNYKNIEPDTGVRADSAPYTVLLSGVVLAGIAALMDRRKRLL